jgi:RHS repeat-associated protein
MDSLGNITHIDYDPYSVLPVRTRSPLGNTIEVENDYRVLSPFRLADPNGNRSEVHFNALGMVVASGLLGKPQAHEGDTLAGFIEAVSGEPLDTPHAFLGRATCRLLIDLFTFERTGQPNFVHSIVRVKHDAELAPFEQSEILQSLAYSDGFGREVQTRTLVEPGPVEGAPTDPRWLCCAWKVYNNKGLVVQEFEPFYSGTCRYENQALHGLPARFTYDPEGRLVRTDFPDGTFRRTDYTTWRMTVWDENDTVGASAWYLRKIAGSPADQDAAAKAFAHRDTPTETLFDPLGRAFLTTEDCGASGRFETRSRLNPHGNLLEMIDPRGNPILRRTYNLLQQIVSEWTAEGGGRLTFYNAAGKPLRTWDSTGFARETSYDALLRPFEVWVAGPVGNVRRLAESTVYGETQPHPEAQNLRTQVYRKGDGAGVVTHEQYDFKGNVTRGRRQFLAEYGVEPDWSAAPGLLPESYVTERSYDALDRVVSIREYEANTVFGQTSFTYSPANWLASLAVLPRAGPPVDVVHAVSYNPRGQPANLVYGNGAASEYSYESGTGRMNRIFAARPSVDDKILQDLHLTFDAAGNLVHLRDDGSEVIFFANAAVSPVWTCTYDPLYRLVGATGREYGGAPPGTGPRDPDCIPAIPHPNDPHALRSYSRSYTYDAAGNIVSMQHAGSWTRGYSYEPLNNRLAATSAGALPQNQRSYTYDAAGNLTGDGRQDLPGLEWDYKGRLQHADLGGGGHAYYAYDQEGRRTRKVVVYQNGNIKERIYLGNAEVFREYSSPAAFASRSLKTRLETLHAHFEDSHFAIVETLTRENHLDLLPHPKVSVRYELSDHLGSSIIELNESAAVIAHEEFYPFGGTSYHARKAAASANGRRHRFAHGEKDEETGLYYFTARYYAPWLGRWLSPDPEPLSAPGWSPYCYVRNSPLNLVDRLGRQAVAWQDWVDLGLRALVGGMIGIPVGLIAGGIVGAVLGVRNWGWAAGLTGGTLLGLTAGVVGGFVAGALVGAMTSPLAWTLLWRAIKAAVIATGEGISWLFVTIGRGFAALGRGIAGVVSSGIAAMGRGFAAMGRGIARLFKRNDAKRVFANPDPGKDGQPSPPEPVTPETSKDLGVPPPRQDTTPPPGEPAEPVLKEDPFKLEEDPLKVKDNDGTSSVHPRSALTPEPAAGEPANIATLGWDQFSSLAVQVVRGLFARA